MPGYGKRGFGIFDIDFSFAIVVDVAVGRSKGKDGTVWKYPGDGCCFPFAVDVVVSNFDFDFELDASASRSVGSGVNNSSPPAGTPFLAALALALSSLFAFALSPAFANISLAAMAFLSASSLAILSRFCILAILRFF